MADTTNETSVTGELITIPHKTDVPALFNQEDGIEKLIARIESEARAVVIDHTTAKGRKEIKSLAAKISRSKTLIDEVGKEENEERNRLNKLVNAKRNLAKERLDALRDEIKMPVDEWEAKEAERVRQHMIRLDTFDLEKASGHDSSATIQAIIATIEGTDIDGSWEEFEADAKSAKSAALVKYQADLGIAQAREKQEAELEELRAEKRRRELEDIERAKAEATAKAEAQEKARIEALAAEKAEQAKAEAIAQAKAAAERYEKELAEAARREELAAQAERERIAAETKAEEEAAAARAADEKIRAERRAEIVRSITDLSPSKWEELVDAMIDGKIKHVRVSI